MRTLRRPSPWPAGVQSILQLSRHSNYAVHGRTTYSVLRLVEEAGVEYERKIFMISGPFACRLPKMALSAREGDEV